MNQPQRTICDISYLPSSPPSSRFDRYPEAQTDVDVEKGYVILDDISYAIEFSLYLPCAFVILFEPYYTASESSSDSPGHMATNPAPNTRYEGQARLKLEEIRYN